MEPPSDNFRLILNGPAILPSTSENVTLVADGRTLGTAKSIFSYKTPDGSYLSKITLDRVLLEPLARSRQIRFEGNKASAITLSGGPSVAAAITRCETDLLRGWKIDDQVSQRATNPRPNADTWLTDADYPAAAMRHGEEGDVIILYRIAQNGRVDECRVVSSSGHQALDDATCNIMKNVGRFSPAMDIDGKPVAKWSRRQVNWRLPHH